MTPHASILAAPLIAALAAPLWAQEVVTPVPDALAPEAPAGAGAGAPVSETEIASAAASAAILAAQDPIAAWEDDPLMVQSPAEAGLDPFLWRARPIVVFADTPQDPAFVQQMGFLAERAADLALRDVVVIADTDPAAESALRRQLRPRGFMMALVGKDGRVALRKPFPWDVREITRSIDSMPLRQQEVRALR